MFDSLNSTPLSSDPQPCDSSRLFADIVAAFLGTMDPAERAAAYAEASRFIRETEGILTPNEASEMFWNTYMGVRQFRNYYRPQATGAALACNGGRA